MEHEMYIYLYIDVVKQILETPSLLAEGSTGVKKSIFSQTRDQTKSSTGSCC